MPDPPVHVDAEAFIAPLTGIRELLDRWEMEDAAEYVRGLLELCRSDPIRLAAELCSVDVWGGSGSLKDLGVPDAQFAERQQRLAEGGRYVRYLIQLAEEMDRQGLADDYIRDWARVNREALEKGW
jgi:hypothetical protein